MTVKKKIKKPSPEKLADDWDFVQTADQLTVLDLMKLALYGSSGSGKSSAAAKLPNPLIGVTEIQSVPIYRRIAPGAKILTIESPGDLARFRRLVTSKDLADHVDSVVLDSFTDAQRIMHDYILAEQKKTRGDMQILTLDNWGVLKHATIGFLRQLRDAPVHVAAIFLDNEETVEGVGQCHRLSVAGSVRHEAAQFFNCVGYQHTRQHVEGVAYQTLFRGPTRYLSKGLPQLNDIEPAEPLSWVAKITGDANILDQKTVARVNAWRAIDGEDTHAQDEKED